MTGRVRWFNKHFGFGFITHNTGEDVFVHHSVIDSDEKGYKTLKNNEIVTYTYRQDNNRFKATKVTKKKKKV